IMESGLTALDAVRCLAERGFELEAERVLEMIRQRLLGDVLQTSAILDEDLNVLSSLTDPNDYAGPGTGYRMSPERRSEVARVRRSIDLGSIGWTAARLSGSSVSVGLQAKGTALIHRADLPPLANLELFSIAPRVTAELYRGLGRNAARYAKGLAPEPLLLPESSEPLGPRYHARVVQLVAIERRLVEDA